MEELIKLSKDELVELTLEELKNLSENELKEFKKELSILKIRINNEFLLGYNYNKKLFDLEKLSETNYIVVNKSQLVRIIKNEI